MNEFKNHLDEDEFMAIKELISATKDKYLIEKVILFGSKSRGDYSEHSDVDLLILTKDKLTPQEQDKFFDICSFINVDYGVAISCLIINLQSWLNGENINPYLKMNVDREGVPIAI
ncbi:nucleotidyltransferase domain-containing protein [Lederbergia sp. NSJ-179]|uniref:nucleotidyltransferase family protein n=1 Tax=Lederbergia sp. NSJ-179 TaxID=2931402 RepID=UPI001FD22349|nr:nucleotidyltransferase domain-containing protein [Lederbergia sp. NSJ-179]MCJ7841604.1 nucleotidyltransferase domain-containing protein [Lederbergia sp. NSJ-179]